ncbi:MAG: DUF4381 domain-containing protein [Candidatus Riflebacteria bacterium]|nr:DUF4381 domain-containing protein [Candidatus Riflebacteria bacterium]
MNPDPTGLAALHDIALPPAVPWWPPAPGWYLVLALLALAATVVTRRVIRRWQADAYRRAALGELASLHDAPAIAELLRRTAIAAAGRPAVAGLTGSAWTDWLAARGPEAMPQGVREMLTAGVYRRQLAGQQAGQLSRYAARWIRGHRPVSGDGRRPD